MPRKPFRIRRPGDGETLRTPSQNLCRACYRPLTTKDRYCSGTCLEAHQRLTRPRSFACDIDETAA